MPDRVVKENNSLVWRITAQLVLLVALSIMVMAGLGYWKLYQSTEENSAIRIDRAARAAGTILALSEADRFAVVRQEDGRPLAVVLAQGVDESALEFRPDYDSLLKEIGLVNQGAANLFRLNTQSGGFERFATTFRKPDGSLPPPLSLLPGHPAYKSLIQGEAFVGEVPVQGRMRLAYLLPILTQAGAVAGALAVDVGWVDDLIAARLNLQNILFGSAVILLALVATLGVVMTNREMTPLRKLARIANGVASGAQQDQLPYLERRDEVGALANGLSRVINLQAQLKKLAYSDSLTGCGNRTRYFADLEHGVAHLQTGQSHWAVVHVDLKRFSQLNDAYGQKTGDAVLKFLGSEIGEVLGPEALISRLTADKFCALVPESHKGRSVEELCNRLIARLGAPLDLSKGDLLTRNDASARNGALLKSDLRLDCRIGIARHTPSDADAEALHRNAALALARAKSQTHAPCVTFSNDLLEEAQRQLKLETMLRQGLAQGQFHLAYQPQICPQSGRLLGLEALARWQHPLEGAIGPDIFIPVAEKTGLIVELGSWVLQESCRQARLWLDAGLEFGHVSINVSPVQLWQRNFVHEVEACLKQYNLSGGNLCIEVTESIFIADDELRIAKILGQFRDMNILVSLDDFGSGYSSLGYLGRLPFNQLKIDRFFVAGADQDFEKTKLLSAIVGLGKGLGLSIVAEGAELPGETALLARLGCDAIQGFYYSKPVPASELAFALDAIQGMVFPACGRNQLAQSA